VFIVAAWGAVVLIAVEGCLAVTTGMVAGVVAVAATMTMAMAVVTGEIEIAVVEVAAAGTTMVAMIVAAAMDLAVVVVGIAVTMTEGVISPQGTIQELCQCNSSSSRQVSISLEHFSDHRRPRLLPIL
jgi:hypothetical protein